MGKPKWVVRRSPKSKVSSKRTQSSDVEMEGQPQHGSPLYKQQRRQQQQLQHQQLQQQQFQHQQLQHQQLQHQQMAQQMADSPSWDVDRQSPTDANMHCSFVIVNDVDVPHAIGEVDHTAVLPPRQPQRPAPHRQRRNVGTIVDSVPFDDPEIPGPVTSVGSIRTSVSARDVIEAAFGPGADLYADVLGVSASATTAQIQAAFFDRRYELYDVMSVASGESPEDDAMGRDAKRRMDAVVAAYELLSDPESRARYEAYRKRKAAGLNGNSGDRGTPEPVVNGGSEGGPAAATGERGGGPSPKSPDMLRKYDETVAATPVPSTDSTDVSNVTPSPPRPDDGVAEASLAVPINNDTNSALPPGFPDGHDTTDDVISYADPPLLLQPRLTLMSSSENERSATGGGGHSINSDETETASNLSRTSSRASMEDLSVGGDGNDGGGAGESAVLRARLRRRRWGATNAVSSETDNNSIVDEDEDGGDTDGDKGNRLDNKGNKPSVTSVRLDARHDARHDTQHGVIARGRSTDQESVVSASSYWTEDSAAPEVVHKKSRKRGGKSGGGLCGAVPACHGAVMCITDEVTGSLQDTASAIDQVWNAFTLKEDEIDAIVNELEGAGKELRRNYRQKR